MSSHDTPPLRPSLTMEPLVRRPTEELLKLLEAAERRARKGAHVLGPFSSQAIRIELQRRRHRYADGRGLKTSIRSRNGDRQDETTHGPKGTPEEPSS